MTEVRDRLREAIQSGDGEQLNAAIEQWLHGTLSDKETVERLEIEQDDQSVKHSS